MTFTIHKGVDMPPIVRRYKKYKYPFRDMSAGSCFFVPCVPSDSDTIRRRVKAAAKAAGAKIIVRYTESAPSGVDVNGASGLLVFLTSSTDNAPPE